MQIGKLISTYDDDDTDDAGPREDNFISERRNSRRRKTCSQIKTLIKTSASRAALDLNQAPLTSPTHRTHRTHRTHTGDHPNQPT